MRKPRKSKPYIMPAMSIEAAANDRGAAMAFFLLENTGTIYGVYRGTIKATDQRVLFGRFIGKGWIILNGNDETVGHSVSLCFGTMRDIVWSKRWVELLH